jgi:hypothetical protein
MVRLLVTVRRPTARIQPGQKRQVLPQSLDSPPALRTLASGKMGDNAISGDDTGDRQ